MIITCTVKLRAALNTVQRKQPGMEVSQITSHQQGVAIFIYQKLSLPAVPKTFILSILLYFLHPLLIVLIKCRY